MAVIEKRQDKKGNLSFRVKVRTRGHPAHSKTFTRMTEAKAYVRQVESAIDEGKFYRKVEGKKHTVAEAIERFISEARVRPQCAYQQMPQLKWWASNIGHLFIGDFTPATFLEMRTAFLNEKDRRDTFRKPQTFNRYRAPLSRVFKCAVQWGWIDTHPLVAVEREMESLGNQRYLSDDELKRLLAACRESECTALSLVVMLAVSTGMRKNEIRFLKWSDVDLKRQCIILQHTKNGEKRRVSIHGKALEYFLKHQKIRHSYTDFVFVGERTKFLGNPLEFRQAFERALKDANIKNFRFHDLRHSCASFLAMNGASAMEIAEILGHKTLQMVKRYSHLRETHTSEVVERMNRRVFG